MDNRQSRQRRGDGASALFLSSFPPPFPFFSSFLLFSREVEELEVATEAASIGVANVRIATTLLFPLFLFLFFFFLPLYF